MRLPKPRFKGELSLEECLKNRRTVRSFQKKALKLDQFTQLLWAGYGITEGFRRTVPSAGALYPMDLYVAIGKDCVEWVDEGVYHYVPEEHSIQLVTGADVRAEISRASLFQSWIADAPVSFIITAEYRRITIKYGDRGIRYAIMEAGHMAQNIFLQAEALGLGAGIVGAFHDEKIIKIAALPVNHYPLLIMPVGYKS
jgi:SagB-type dehydrogenase family enzyme